MATRCTVCLSPHRSGLERFISTGGSQRAASRKFSLSVDAIHRHYSNHLTEAVKVTLRDHEGIQPLSEGVARLQAIADDAQAARHALIEQADYARAEKYFTIERLATNDLSQKLGVNDSSVADRLEWQQAYQTATVLYLRDHPEAHDAFLSHMRSVGFERTAKDLEKILNLKHSITTSKGANK